MELLGRRFKTTAVKYTDRDAYKHFGIDPRHRHVWCVSKDTPIYEIEFEVVEEYAKYPKDAHQIEYWCRAKIEEWNNGQCIPLEEPEFSLVESNVILFTIQFCQPVFEYQFREGFGVVCRLKIVGVKEI